MAEAVDLIDGGRAPRIAQTEDGASYEPMLNKKESSMVRIDELTADQLHNFIRGCDKVPGAWITLDEQPVKLYGSQRWTKGVPHGLEVQVLGKGSVEYHFFLKQYFNVCLDIRRRPTRCCPQRGSTPVWDRRTGSQCDETWSGERQNDPRFKLWPR